MYLVCTFTAFPKDDQQVIKMLALTGEMLRLECPYQLGIASNSINPYHHVWLYANNSDAVIPNSGRMKTIYVDVNQDSNDCYSCAIKMKRCSECSTVHILPTFYRRAELKITKAGECSHLIYVYVPHTLRHLVQSLFSL